MTDDLTAELAKAKRIADALQFACRIPDRKPDFFACGGPAAEAYWDYFTPARIVTLVAALEAVLKLADDDDLTTRFFRERSPWTIALREAITRALKGESSG